MVETTGDSIEARADPALIDRSGDPTRKLPAETHQVEKRGTESTNRDDLNLHGGLPTQVELATLRRVPAKIPWRGKWDGSRVHPDMTDFHSVHDRFRRARRAHELLRNYSALLQLHLQTAS